MKKAMFLFLLLLAATALNAQEIMPLDQIQPGMPGVCRTVFSGYQPEEFPVEVVEILRDFSPNRNLILIRLKGQKAEFTGVAAGMSGSPVYLEGKLAGALSYSLGVFVKEPLAGVTPISEMFEIFDREATRDRELAAFSAQDDNKFLEMAMGVEEVKWENFIPSRLYQRSAQTSGSFQPILLPISFGGFQSALVERASELLRPAGFIAVGGSSVANDKASADDLVPGSAIGAVLMTGDADIQAIGTVTFRDKDRVLAFGHPFFNSGPVEMPISLAKILTIVPSELSAFKIGASSVLVGALRQDRGTGIYGTVGDIPELVPLKLAYTDEAGKKTEFEFEFSDDRSLTALMPLIVRFVLVNALESARLATGENSLRLDGEVRFQEGGKIKLDNFYPGMMQLNEFGAINGIFQSSGEVAAVLGAVMANNFQPVQITDVDLHFSSMPGRRTATIEQVWVDRSVVEAGDTVSVYARVKPYWGAEIVVKQNLPIPANTSGSYLSVVVSGGPQLTMLEQRTQPGRFAVHSFNQLTKLLNARRPNDLLYFQLRAPDRGLIIDGEELTALPPTTYAIFQSQSLRGNASSARERTLFETHQEIAMPGKPNLSPVGGQDHLPHAVSGAKIIRLKLR